MSLTKIPFLLSATVGIHITMTPPNSAAKSAPSSRVPPRGFERLAPLFPRIAKVGHLAVHAGFWCCGLAEIALIVAHHVSPSSKYFPWAAPLLRTLDPHARAALLTPTPLFLLGWLLNLAGTSLRIACYRRLRSLFTFELAIHTDHPLITSGPYAIVRHPSYSGALLAALGVALCHLSPGTWLVECAGLFEPQNRRILAAVWAVGASVICAALTSRMRKEDAMLQKNFGREWDEWAARVPYKIIPGLY